MKTSPILRFRAVSRVFVVGSIHQVVLDGLYFDVMPGDFTVITGPSGSGKTTLLHLAALFDRPTSGDIVYRDQSLGGLTEHELNRIRAEQLGIVFQRYHLFPYRSVLENVLFRFRYWKEKPPHAHDKALQAMEILGIAHLSAKPARLLSGGEMQRVAIARAMVADPAVLIADEPTGNLDTACSEQVMDWFAKVHRETGMTMLVVTHNLAWLRVAKNHYALHNGTLHREELA